MVADIDIESECLYFLGELRFDVWAVWLILKLRRYRAKFSYLPASGASNASMSTGVRNGQGEGTTAQKKENVDWKEIEDDFIVFWSSNVSHGASKTMQSPKSRLQDGLFRIMIVRGAHMSRYRLIRILLSVDDGKHIDHPDVEFLECTAFCLEPLTPGSFNDVDGEVVEDGPIEARILPSSWRSFARVPLPP